MKGWMVGDYDNGFVWVRAETRGRAKRYCPFDADFTAIIVKRAPWLDGGDMEREVWIVTRYCEGPFDDFGNCTADHDCVEGSYIDREATLARIPTDEAEERRRRESMLELLARR